MTDSSLTVATYNIYREQNGRDPLLGELLRTGDALVCLQEVGPWRALWMKRAFGARAFVSLAKHGLHYLAVVVPEGARFAERRTASLNGYRGSLPRPWSLRRSSALYRAGRRTWVDGLDPRVAQVTRVAWEGRTFGLVNTHLPYEPWLRDRCLDLLPRFLCAGDVILTGDLNATTRDVFLGDLLLATGLRPAGDGRATLGRRRVDFVLYRGGFREAGYAVERGLSDHRMVRAELEVL